MSEILALTRAQFRSGLTYRIRTLLSFGGVIISVVPLFFIGNAVQPIMGGVIQTQGGQAFDFLLLGMIGATIISASVMSLPTIVGGGVNTGTLEALFATPTSRPRLFFGLTLYPLLFMAVRSVLLLAFGWALGADIHVSGLLPSMLILVLLALAHLPIGLIGAALVLMYRTAGPIPYGVVLVSTLLGGVYYPIQVIPGGLDQLSAFIPLTYGLNAFRGLLLEGAPFSAVLDEIGALILLGEAGLVVGVFAMHRALRYARNRGTLSQY